MLWKQRPAPITFWCWIRKLPVSELSGGHTNKNRRKHEKSKCHNLRIHQFISNDISIILCTWSGWRCPSSIWLSFCSASRRKTSPRCRRSSLYSVRRRHFGMNKHRICIPTLYGIGFLLGPSWISFLCALAAHIKEFPRWTPLFVKLLLPPRQSRGISQRIRRYLALS